MAKHLKTKKPSDRDLVRNPGIGLSKGTTRADAAVDFEPDGDNTVQGDVENDVSYGGGVDPNQIGRTNK